MAMATGTYVGSGAGRTVAVGFAPTRVTLWDSGSGVCERVAIYADEDYLCRGSGVGTKRHAQAGQGIAFGALGFTVGPELDRAGETWRWEATD